MIDDELLTEFLVESAENLDRLDRDFIELERDPGSREILASIFRTVHTIKGTCGFLGFTTLESVTHVGESLLGRLRDGELTVDAEITSALLRMVDAVREMLAAIEAGGSEGSGDYRALVEQLTRLRDGRPAPERSAVPDPAVPVPPGAPGPAAVEEAVRQVAEVAEAAGVAGRLPDSPGRPGGRSVADTSVRVDVALLDGLVDLVGELVLARNQLVQTLGVRGPAKSNPGAMASARVSQLTTELQERVMKTRMQPVTSVWGKLPRVVRDLAVQCGKQVRVEMEGQDTELDRTIVEAIRDPLTHLVRNAVDHGIEAPDVRVARGKPAEGRLQLRAFHEGGKVVIEIADDGGGIDPARVRAKAVEKGLIGPAEAAELSDADAVALIFQPGFSTAERVSNISGRGVGMDVVKTNIERIGGTLDVHSAVGRGTTLVIRIPLTLAIVPALIVVCGGDRFAVPQPNVVELVRLKRGVDRLERIDGALFHRLRGELLPVVDLGRVLDLGGDRDAAGPRSLVVVRVDGRSFGVLVDRVADAEEIVVKPLGGALRQVPGFAGCTIMGDGTVALILDVTAIADRAGIAARSLDGPPPAPTVDTDAEQLLLCSAGGVRLAVPLNRVSRLEHVRPEAIELAGSQEVVRSGATLVPVVRLAPLVGGWTSADTPRLKMVLLHGAGGRTLGAVVDAIDDAVEVPVTALALHGTGRPAVLGSAVIDGHVADVVDVDALLDSVDPSFYTPVAFGQR